VTAARLPDRPVHPFGACHGSFPEGPGTGDSDPTCGLFRGHPKGVK
jgi:hypothetical protein